MVYHPAARNIIMLIDAAITTTLSQRNKQA